MSVNQCNFIGRIGKIDARFMPNGDAVTSIQLAVDDSYKDKNGNKVEQTDWVPVVFFKALAEIVSKYGEKGRECYVSGKFKPRKYSDKEGNIRYTTEIKATDFKLIGSRLSSDQGSSTAYQKQDKKEQSGFDDDDIPF
jgi:single-strand DNA-binding protein